LDRELKDSLYTYTGHLQRFQVDYDKFILDSCANFIKKNMIKIMKCLGEHLLDPNIKNTIEDSEEKVTNLRL